MSCEKLIVTITDHQDLILLIHLVVIFVLVFGLFVSVLCFLSTKKEFYIQHVNYNQDRPTSRLLRQ